MNPYEPTAISEPNARHSEVTWRPFEVFAIAGPVTGALIGCTQTLVQVAVFCVYGQPSDFYFRGLGSAVGTLLPCVTVGGGLVGFPFGLVVVTTLHLTHRSIRPWSTLVKVVAITSAATLCLAIYEFEEYTRHVWAHTQTALVLAFATCVVCSRPRARVAPEKSQSPAS